jgi:hypothetical protein
MKHSSSFRAAFLVFSFLFASQSAQALVPGEEKNMRGRLGLGFTNQIAVTADRTVPALSSKYYMDKTTAVGFGVGFDTRSTESHMAVGIKGFKNIFTESNLIFYMGLGAAYVNYKGSKIQGSAFIGSEFFFDKIPSLGLSFEAGIRGDAASGSFAVRTTGDSFLTAGMHFYL